MIVRAVKWLAALAAISLATAAHAQDYPKRPISMIVPFAAGGALDVKIAVPCPEGRAS